MWSSADIEKRKKPKRLSKEILRSFGVTFLISSFSFWILNEAANRVVLDYVENELWQISEYQLIDIQYGILGISFISAIILFIILFLFFVGERLAYINEIVKGINALGRHEWDYEIPLQGENELTELAERVNELSKEEKAFQEKEKQMQEEKISLIRSLSHDIRTPLTSMLSYSEYMKAKENLTTEEIKAYMDLVEQKSQQIKVLTDRLLDGGSREPEYIENGLFFMQQLIEEWELELESEFDCQVDLSNCPRFSGEFDVQEMRRIFDNLASNIRKYADAASPIQLQIIGKDGGICISQSNRCKILDMPVESTKIGIESIRKMLAHYGGKVETVQKDGIFRISLELPCNFL